MSTNSQFTVMVHILTALAAVPEPLPSSAIADSVNSNPVTIRKTISKLREAGMVTTIAGSNGGAVLRQKPADISLADVYVLIKEDSPFGMHANTPNPHCPIGGKIQGVLAEVYAELDEQMLDALSTTSIQDILERIMASHK